jgi:hypothetical protein
LSIASRQARRAPASGRDCPSGSIGSNAGASGPARWHVHESFLARGIRVSIWHILRSQKQKQTKNTQPKNWNKPALGAIRCHEQRTEFVI